MYSRYITLPGDEDTVAPDKEGRGEGAGGRDEGAIRGGKGSLRFVVRAAEVFALRRSRGKSYLVNGRGEARVRCCFAFRYLKIFFFFRNDLMIMPFAEYL